MNTALIVAGGSGARMGQDIPKQFINVYDKPVLFYTLADKDLAGTDLLPVNINPGRIRSCQQFIRIRQGQVHPPPKRSAQTPWPAVSCGSGNWPVHGPVDD